MSNQLFYTFHNRAGKLITRSPITSGVILAGGIAGVCAALTFASIGIRTAEITTPEVTPSAYVQTITMEAEPSELVCYSDVQRLADVTRLAQTVYGEARGVDSKAEQAAVIWCILNRVDDPRWPDTIEEVCTPSQFHGYNPSNPVTPEFYELAEDVLSRYQREQAGEVNVGRTLPSEYVYFHGDGTDNHFRTEYYGQGIYWNWGLPSPYPEDYQ